MQFLLGDKQQYAKAPAAVTLADSRLRLQAVCQIALATDFISMHVWTQPATEGRVGWCTSRSKGCNGQATMAPATTTCQAMTMAVDADTTTTGRCGFG